MKENKSKNRKWLIVLQALLLGVAAFLFCYNDVLFSLNSLYRDKVYQRSRGVNQSIKIIAVDDKAIAEYGPFGTWDRSIYADVLDALGDYPAAVGFDIMFQSQMSEEGDRSYLGGQSPHFGGQTPHWVGSRWGELLQSGIGFGDGRWPFHCWRFCSAHPACF